MTAPFRSMCEFVAFDRFPCFGGLVLDMVSKAFPTQGYVFATAGGMLCCISCLSGLPTQVPTVSNPLLLEVFRTSWLFRFRIDFLLVLQCLSNLDVVTS